MYAKAVASHCPLGQRRAVDPHSDAFHMFRAADDIDSKLEWQKLALGGLLIHEVPGEHLEILQEPNVQVLAQKITLALKQCAENRYSN